MKKIKKFDNILIICIMMILYMIPVTSIDSNSNFNIYYYFRLVFIVLALILFVKRLKIRKGYFIFIAVFLFRLILYKEISINLILLMSCLYIFDYLLEVELEFDKINKLILFFSISFLIQIIVATIYKGKMQINSFIGDNNYTGYFIFFFFTYFFYTKNKMWILWMTLALFTFSRATIIAIALLILFYIIQGRKKILTKESNDRFIKLIFLIGQILIIPISYIFVYKFNTIDYTYTYVQGFQRLGNLMDNSNYLRFVINILAIKSFNFKNLLIGLQGGTFAGINYLDGKTLFPHNTMLVLYIHFGIIVSVMYLYKYVKLYKKCNNEKLMPIYIGMIIYQIFLGPSSFYGVELLIFMIIIKGINECLIKKEKIKNEY